MRRFGADIEWRPFDLHPEYPAEGIPAAELERRYGGDAWRRRLHAMFDEAGLPHTREIDRVPNSRKALRLAELARDRGRHTDIHGRLFDAYWVRGLDIGDDAVLLEEAGAAGLHDGMAADVLAGERYLDRVQEDTRALLELGGGGVPAWLVDDRALIPGAQPHETFGRILERLGHEPLSD